MPDDEIFTIRELAADLKIAEKTAYRFVSEGRIPGKVAFQGLKLGGLEVQEIRD